MSRQPESRAETPPADAPKQRVMRLPARVDIAGATVVIRYDQEGPGTLRDGRISASHISEPAEGAGAGAAHGEIVLSPYALEFVAIMALMREVLLLARARYDLRPMTAHVRDTAACTTALLVLTECGVLYPLAEQAARAWVREMTAHAPAVGDAKGAGE